MDEIEDLADTAALIENLDLVISIDTSVAHLAGALAKPVWLLTRFESDWRWMLNREDSPWYPTMRIFTQKNSGDWDELITRVAKELQSWHSQASRVTPELSGHASMAEMQAIIEPFSKQNWLELERLANDLCTRYPQDGFGFKSLGVALQMQNKNVQALDMMRKAAELMPSDADVHNNLAGILKQAGDIDSAISHFETAIKIRPDFVEAINNLGMVYYELGQPEKALAYCRKALGLNPVSATTLYNLGVASREAGRNAEAIDYYERALTSRPNDVNILWNLSLALLSSGQYERGWQKYETRFALPSKKPLAQTPYPCWLGKEKIAGKKILIQSEQGIGDAFQMLRYISLLEQQGAECWIQVFQPMRGIISRSFPKAKVIDEHTSPAGLDYRIPLMSLPLAMQTFTEASIPNKVPYLLADSARIAYWQRQLSGPTATVGLVWRGSPNNANDRQRSITIEKVLPLITAHPSIQFVSLQKHLSDTEHKKLRGLKNLRIIDSELTDFDETAAIMANLNVIISVDSAPVHLSAAMGKPTWLLLSFKFDWRWMTGRKDSPWYPTLRIFNQSKAGDWNNVISDVSTALGKQLLAHQARKR
jgi:tetratricopeptide (TPR) repeat protein